MIEFCKCVSCCHVLCDNIIMLEWFLCSDWTTLCFCNQNEFSETLTHTIIRFNFQRDRYFLPLSKQNLIFKLTLSYHIRWYHILNAFSGKKISDQLFSDKDKFLFINIYLALKIINLQNCNNDSWFRIWWKSSIFFTAGILCWLDL